MIKVLVTDEIDLSGTALLSKKKFYVECNFGINNSEILKKYNDFDILVIRSIRKIDKNFLDKSSFKIIATCSKGTDHIDVEYAVKKGIVILNAYDSNNISAAEHTFALILSIFKKINLSDKLVRENRFTFLDFERNELFGKSIGIIGYGKVGSYVYKISEAFGMKVFANDADKNVLKNNKGINFKSLNFIFKKCDIVTIHIPLNKKNYLFVSKEKLDLLNKNSVLINTSRGDVISEKHLYNLLKNRKIKFAGLDVMSNEPNVFKGFASLDNVLLTNHIAGKTIESRKNISKNIFKSIYNFYN